MGKVLVGVTFIILGGFVNVGEHIVELTPNFIGSFLLLLALKGFKIKDQKLIVSLWLLTGLYLFNYILPLFKPDVIPLEVQPLLVGIPFLWGIWSAIKIVQHVSMNLKDSDQVPLKRMYKWFKVLLVLSVISGLGLIGFRTTNGVVDLIGVWLYVIGTFAATLARYMLLYLFYKAFKGVQSIS